MNAIDRERLLKWLKSLDSTYVRNEIIMKIESGAFDIKQPEVPDLYVDVLDKLIEGLRWYANPKHWYGDETFCPPEGISTEEDCGQRARDILKEIGANVE